MQITKTVARLATALVLVGLGPPAFAQQTLSVPAEQPPAGFQGSQFADSKGCVFIRAGVGNSVTWVPRVTRDRKPVCGFEPTFQSKTTRPAASTEAIEVVEIPAPVQAPQSTKAVVVPTPAPQKARVQRIASNQSLEGVVVLSDTTATETLSPKTRVLPKHIYDNRKAVGTVKTPRGYRPAWQDGRLNPRRAEQTLEGQDQMRLIWTDTVPRRLVEP